MSESESLPCSPVRPSQAASRSSSASVSPSVTIISSSDFGEREQRRAKREGESYWGKDEYGRRERIKVLDNLGLGEVLEEDAEEQGQGQGQEQEEEEEQQDAPPPSWHYYDEDPNPHSSPSSSPSTHHAQLVDEEEGEPPTSRHPSPRVQPTTSITIPSSPPSPASMNSDLPSQLFIRRPAPPRKPQPAPSSPKNATASTSRLSASPSPSQSQSPSPPPQPSPPVNVGGRSFRTRTLAQLKPFTVEQTLYSKTLLKNGWKGAVVALPRPPAREGEDKSKGKMRVTDDLGGWLELEEGEVGGVVVSESDSGSADEDDDEAEVSGNELLERGWGKKDHPAGQSAAKPKRPAQGNRTTKVKKRRKHTSAADPFGDDRDGEDDEAWVEGGREWFDGVGAYAGEREDVRTGFKRGTGSTSGVTRMTASGGHGGEASKDSFGSRRGDDKDKKGKRREWDFLDEEREGNEDVDMDGPSSTAKHHSRHSFKPTTSKQGSTSSKTDSSRRKTSTSKSKRNNNSDSSSRRRVSKSKSNPTRQTKSNPSKPLAQARRGQSSKVMRTGALDREILETELSSGSEQDEEMDYETMEMNYEAMELDAFSPEEDRGSASSSSSVEVVEAERKKRKERKYLVGTKEKKFLGRMMPAVVAKKMLADVQLMEKERAEKGEWDGESDEVEEDDVDEIREKEETDKRRRERRKRKGKEKARLWDFGGLDMLFGGGESLESEGLSDDWASVGSFSVDFSIARFDTVFERDEVIDTEVDTSSNGPPRLPTLGFVRSGRLSDLLKSSQSLILDSLHPQHSPTAEDDDICAAFPNSFVVPLSLSPTTLSLPTFSTLLPQLFKTLQESTKTFVSTPSPVMLLRGNYSVAEALAWLGRFVTRRLGKFENKDVLDEVFTQFNNLKTCWDREEEEATGEIKEKWNVVRKGLDWWFVDVAVRIHQIRTASNPDSVDDQHILTPSRLLISRLLRPSALRATVASLQSLATSRDRELFDPSISSWLGLISLALSPETTNGTLSEKTFWTLVLEEMGKTLSGGRGAGLKDHLRHVETKNAVTTMVCAISQFMPDGSLAPEPRICACWKVIEDALDLIPLDLLSNSLVASSIPPSSKASISAVERYISTIARRCASLIGVWGWKFRAEDKAVNKLFAPFRVRHLGNLLVEMSGSPGVDGKKSKGKEGFPKFLLEMVGHRTTPEIAFDALRDQNFWDDAVTNVDSIFTIFLKLLVQYSHDTTQLLTPSSRSKAFIRFFTLLTPIVQKPWTSSSPELVTPAGITPLINHYSLLILFALLHPASAQTRLDQSRRFIVFAQLSDPARKVTLRCVYLLGEIFGGRGDRTGVVDWVRGLVTVIAGEARELESERREGGKMGEREKEIWWRKSKLIMGALEIPRRWLESDAENQDEEKGTSFPRIELLDPAWTTDILQLGLSQDPLIGLGVTALLTTFLEIRDSSLRDSSPVLRLPSSSLSTKAKESQEDYGDDEIDYDDPALNALLGPVGKSVAQPTDGKAADHKFSQTLTAAEGLEPALFDFVCKIFAKDPSHPPYLEALTHLQRSKFAQKVVGSWTNLIQVVIENSVSVNDKVTSWGLYLEFGPRSWRRVPDPVGKREVGLALALRCVQADHFVFTKHQDSLHDIWIQSMVAAHLTYQHHFTELLLNEFASFSPLFQRLSVNGLDLPTSMEMGQYQLSLDDFRRSRMLIIRAVFENMALFLSPTSLASASTDFKTLSKSNTLQLLRNMTLAATDNLSALSSSKSASSTEKLTYLNFCRNLLEAVNICGPGVNELSVPGIKMLNALVATG